MLTRHLPKALQPFAKAIWPALSTLAAVAAQWTVTGSFDQLELATGVAGVVASAIAYLARNKINPRQLEIQVFLEVLRELHDEINARDRVVPKSFDDQWRPK